MTNCSAYRQTFLSLNAEQSHVRAATSGARPILAPLWRGEKRVCNSTESVLRVYDSSPSADETHRLSSNNPSTNLRQSIRTSSKMGKVHGSLARAGKVKSQTPKVEKQEKKKTPKGRAKKRLTYTRRFVNVQLTGGKRKMNPNPTS
ncbi:hypothetical protein FJTKL_08366 [Diaporthe vaccinii]|uniref:40S ribosomal protein S30 n=2 Tax=Diaporthe TaxID=36922 RepID=A0ABR4ERV0_9PEZI